MTREQVEIGKCRGAEQQELVRLRTLEEELRTLEEELRKFWRQQARLSGSDPHKIRVAHQLCLLLGDDEQEWAEIVGESCRVGVQPKVDVAVSLGFESKLPSPRNP